MSVRMSVRHNLGGNVIFSAPNSDFRGLILSSFTTYGCCHPCFYIISMLSLGCHIQNFYSIQCLSSLIITLSPLCDINAVALSSTVSTKLVSIIRSSSKFLNYLLILFWIHNIDILEKIAPFSFLSEFWKINIRFLAFYH